MTFRRLIAPMTVATMLAITGGEALAQGAFPAPPPGQEAGQANDPALPSGNGSSPTANPMKAPPSQAECMEGFPPLRAEAEKRGQLIRAASQRHAPPDEACRLIADFGQTEIKMIKYVDSRAMKCGVPTQVADQLRNAHKNTEVVQNKVCTSAQQLQIRGPVGPTGDFEVRPTF
jgi:hypothetical protein